jgi:formyl-CoA transferase
VGYVRLLTKHRRPYQTKDGWICVLAINDEQWRRILPALGRPELVSDPRFASTAGRVANYDELYGIVSAQLAGRTTAEWHEIFDREDIPNGSLHSLQELLNDPYLHDTGFFHKYQHPTEGAMVATAVPVQFSATPAGLPRPPPTLGQHNSEVLGELGLNAEAIVRVAG